MNMNAKKTTVGEVKRTLRVKSHAMVEHENDVIHMLKFSIVDPIILLKHLSKVEAVRPSRTCSHMFTNLRKV